MKRVLVAVLALLAMAGPADGSPVSGDLVRRTGDGVTLAMAFDTNHGHSHVMIDPFQLVPVAFDGSIHVTVILLDGREIHFGDDHDGSMGWADPPLFDGVIRFGLPGGIDADGIIDVCLGAPDYLAAPGGCPGPAGFYNRFKGGPAYADLDAVPQVVRLA